MHRKAYARKTLPEKAETGNIASLSEYVQKHRIIFRQPVMTYLCFQKEEWNMIKAGSIITIYNYGSYNSDDHLMINVTVEEKGYSISSSAASAYDRSTKGSQCHVPYGFFCKPQQDIMRELEKKKIIPDYFSDKHIHLKEEATDMLYQFDQEARYHKRML